MSWTPVGLMKAFVSNCLSSQLICYTVSPDRSNASCVALLYSPCSGTVVSLCRQRADFDSVIVGSGYANNPFCRSDKHSTNVKHFCLVLYLDQHGQLMRNWLVCAPPLLLSLPLTHTHIEKSQGYVCVFNYYSSLFKCLGGDFFFTSVFHFHATLECKEQMITSLCVSNFFPHI